MASLLCQEGGLPLLSLGVHPGLLYSEEMLPGWLEVELLVLGGFPGWLLLGEHTLGLCVSAFLQYGIWVHRGFFRIPKFLCAGVGEL